ncbi:MAG: hypothetical protein H7A36_04060 [Chlamydiales bacterium]|nr:hypothetical protein [Chlamydiales bacterium]
MESPQEIEQAFQKYMGNLTKYAPDGIVEVDLQLMQELDLLHSEEAMECDNSELTHSFYVVESHEKLTLFNDRFVVWIVPQLVDDTATTYTLIALNEEQKNRLEMVFATSGVYNHSSLVLRILEKFLDQIDENEEEIYNL